MADLEVETVYDPASKKVVEKCLICNIFCDTKDIMKTHLLGKNHLKKSEREMYMKKSKELIFFCEICDVSCSSSENLEDHYKGKNHIKMVEKLNSTAKLDISVENEIINTNFNAALNGFIRCDICAINCDTIDQFEVHKKGKAHLKNESKFAAKNKSDLSNISSNFYCSTCDVSCSSQGNLESHEKGQAHLKKISKHNSSKSGSRNSSESNKRKQTNVIQQEENIPTCKSRTPSISSNSDNETKINSKNPLLLKLLEPDKQNECTYVCKICKVTSNTMDQYLIHCNAVKHKRKLNSFNLPAADTSFIQGELDEEMESCEICDIKIHKNNIESHKEGKLHKEQLIKSKKSLSSIDEFVLPKVIKEFGAIEYMDPMFSKFKLQPRSYQKEIFARAINKDCVIFLPTGTGKTLIGVMALFKMLQENPFHRVIFLVDKVLLVMQQKKFISEQLEGICLNRFDENSHCEVRTLRVIGLANEFVDTNYTGNIRDHDIIVATAGLFFNNLTNKKLFWRDFSLCVLDEAHHCTKNHPYNRLLREYHLYPKEMVILSSDATSYDVELKNKDVLDVDETKMAKWKEERCKIIGLTASPAGNVSQDKTVELLEMLLRELGGVDIIGVEEFKADLKMFTSMNKIICKKVNYTDQETVFRDFLSNTIILLLRKFENGIDNNSSILRFINSSQSLPIEEVCNIKSQVKNSFNQDITIFKSALSHIMDLFVILEDLDTLGYQVAAKALHELRFNQNNVVWFENNALLFEKNSQEILEGFQEKNLADINSSLLRSLVEEIKNLQAKWSKSDSDDDCHKVLLLVQERQMVYCFKEHLNKCLEGIEVIPVVGHGSNQSSTVQKRFNKKKPLGMSVLKQKKALEKMKKKQNQLIIATSVAEEGIDLPECDLVILINPPNTVQSLVQIRGRARKLDSSLLMMFRDEMSQENLELLIAKEENVEKAINIITNKEIK